MGAEDWIAAVVRSLQVMALEASCLDRHRARDLFGDLAAVLPANLSLAEELILEGILLKFALRFGRSFHEHFHRDHDELRRCQFSPTAVVDEVWIETRGVRQVFIEWAVRFQVMFDRQHPVSVVERCADAIKEHYRTQLRLSALAAELAVTPSLLRIKFRSAFGISVADYQDTFRILKAIEQLDKHKVEAIALDVGYRSKKDFYQAFRRLTGTTPASFRTLPNHQTYPIIQQIEVRLLPRRRPPTTRVSKPLEIR